MSSHPWAVYQTGRWAGLAGLQRSGGLRNAQICQAFSLLLALWAPWPGQSLHREAHHCRWPSEPGQSPCSLGISEWAVKLGGPGRFGVGQTPTRAQSHETVGLCVRGGVDLSANMLLTWVGSSLTLMEAQRVELMEGENPWRGSCWWSVCMYVCVYRGRIGGCLLWNISSVLLGEKSMCECRYVYVFGGIM